MKIWFILGPIGAGKSTLVHKIQQAHNIIYLSADLLKKENGMSYEATRDQMGRIISHHVKNNISFITEGTGQHSDMYDLFCSYKQNVNIELHIIYINIDLATCIKRNKFRTRVLSNEIVKEVYDRSSSNRHLWKDFGCIYIDFRDLLVDNFDFSKIY
jgi:tRNA uridine 5-carbamoylmethylation protein Kti12